MNPLSRLNNATPPIFTGVVSSLNDAFVWNYLEMFAAGLTNAQPLADRIFERVWPLPGTW